MSLGLPALGAAAVDIPALPWWLLQVQAERTAGLGWEVASPRDRQLVVLWAVEGQCTVPLCGTGLWEETDQLVCPCPHPFPTQAHGQGTAHKEVRDS